MSVWETFWNACFISSSLKTMMWENKLHYKFLGTEIKEKVTVS